jgi:hypothetical protein
MSRKAGIIHARPWSGKSTTLFSAGRGRLGQEAVKAVQSQYLLRDTQLLLPLLLSSLPLVRCGKVAQSLWGIEIFSYHRCLSSSSIKAVREGSIISGLSLTHTAVSASRQCPEGVPTLRLIARIDICIDEEKTSNIQSRGYANAEKLAYRVPQKATTSSC